jgi:rubrerythrin
MPSTVGLQRTEVGVVEQAVKLELDCVAAYAEAAACAPAGDVADRFETMAEDCLRHVSLWQDRLEAMGRPPVGPNAVTEGLNAGKVRVASLFGTRAVAMAVRNNPRDTTTAYERVSHRTDLTAETRDLAQRMLPDAARHLGWIEALLRGNVQVKAAPPRGDSPPPPPL